MRIRTSPTVLTALAAAALAGCAAQRPTDSTIAHNRQAIDYLSRVTADMAYMGATEEEVHRCRIELTEAGALMDEQRYGEALDHLMDGVECANRVSIALHQQLEDIRDNPKIDLRIFLGRELDWGKGKYRIIGIQPQPLPDGTHFSIHFESESGLQKSVEFHLQ